MTAIAQQPARPSPEKDGVQAPQYRSVWLSRDWPKRDGKKGNGIDLVAERQDVGVNRRPGAQARPQRQKHAILVLTGTAG